MIVYPKLGNYDFGWFRAVGPGLANCLFIVAKAYLIKEQYHCEMIAPTWRNISIGAIIRNERDKRRYPNLFITDGISGIKKIGYLLGAKLFSQKFKVVKDISGYFTSFYGKEDSVRTYINSIINTEAISTTKNIDCSNSIGIHVRLGDYPLDRRTPIEWYKKVILTIQQNFKDIQFNLYSDGTDEELKQLIALPNVNRVFYGNALADIIALGKNQLIIGSDSTFSAWSAFLGNKPILFAKRHFPAIYSESNSDKEFIVNNPEILPEQIIRQLQSTFKWVK